MWDSVAKIFFKNRIAFLVSIILITCFMLYHAIDVKLSFAGEKKILPVTDSSFGEYLKFKEKFGEDGNVMVIGVQSERLFNKDFFNRWYALSKKIKATEGIKEVVSIGLLYNLQKDTASHRFALKPIITGPIQNDQQADSVKAIVQSLPFYRGLIYQPESSATLMAITFNPQTGDIKSRTAQITNLIALGEEFGKAENVDVHFSGLPYIRTVISQKIVSEFQLFIGLALAITSIILWFFFRSISAVVFPLLVVAVGVIWSIGLMTIIGYKITILTGLIAPLLIVIGVPNSILMLNKYYSEFKKHGDQMRGLVNTVRHISISTLVANITTATGFAVFYFTDSELLVEFGVIAALGIIITWMISLILIPIIFSYLPTPTIHNLRDEEDKFLGRLISRLDHWVHFYRPQIYILTGVLVIVSLIGMWKMDVDGYMVDDLPKKDPVYMDLKFFEQNFNGVLPFEVTIDTKKKNGVVNPKALNKINELEELMANYSEFSKPVSLNAVLKFSTQAYYNGNPNKFIVPSSMERNFILSYAAGKSANTNSLLRSFVDSNKQVTRLSFQMADLGSRKMNKLVAEVQPKVDSIFAESGYHVTFTGGSMVFLKGNNYLITNLRESLILAIILVSIIMFILFRSWQMIIISLLPNIIPLGITAALMGFCDINLKPSTVLIFSIALGLASDQTIYFLTKYRQELKYKTWSISETVSIALRETGVSMIYTAIILFAGFSIFLASTFGGTVLLGLLISFTVLMALIFNLVLLPTLLLSLEKVVQRKSLADPLIRIYDEEEDINLDELEIK